MNNKFNEVVRAIIFNSEGKVLILQRPDGSYCLPGGIVEASDLSLELGLLRELDEEVAAKVESIVFFDEEVIRKGLEDWINYYYLCVISNPETLNINEESLALIWVSEDELELYDFSFKNEFQIEKAFSLAKR